jgi:enoyl-CoA hydratase
MASGSPTLPVARRHSGFGSPARGDDIVRKVYGSDDFKEGVRAFVEKCPPRWRSK